MPKSQPPTRAHTGRFLLIDISNSFTKLALASPDELLKTAKLPTAGLTFEKLARKIRRWPFETVVISSVVPKAERSLRRGFSRASARNRPQIAGHPERSEAQRNAVEGSREITGDLARIFTRSLDSARDDSADGTHSPIRILHVSPKLNLGVGIDYPQPNKIGADRLANAASATALYGAPIVVVDFGTAVTFDIISAERKYIGGVIAPGLEVMTDYLYQRTALLPKIALSEPVSAIGKSTRNAMMAGAIFGYRGLVKQILAEIRRELGGGKRLSIVATGGYAELIAAGLPELRQVHPNLTLEGLRIIGTLNT